MGVVARAAVRTVVFGGVRGPITVGDEIVHGAPRLCSIRGIESVDIGGLTCLSMLILFEAEFLR